MLRTVCRNGWFCTDIHPSPCRWCDSTKEGGKVSMGTGSKSDAEGGKQGAFCPGKPMSFALLARCKQRELWGLDAFSVHACQLLPTWGSDPISSNSFAFLSHCTHVPWGWRFRSNLQQQLCFPVSLHPCTLGLAVQIQSPATALLSCLTAPMYPGVGGSDPISSNSFAFLSHCTHVPWGWQSQSFHDVLLLRHLVQGEPFPWATWKLTKHDLADLRCSVLKCSNNV